MPTIAKRSAPSHITKARRFDGFEGMIWLSSSQVLELDDEFEAVDEEEDQRPEYQRQASLHYSTAGFVL